MLLPYSSRSSSWTEVACLADCPYSTATGSCGAPSAHVNSRSRCRLSGCHGDAPRRCAVDLAQWRGLRSYGAKRTLLWSAHKDRIVRRSWRRRLDPRSGFLNKCRRPDANPTILKGRQSLSLCGRWWTRCSADSFTQYYNLVTTSPVVQVRSELRCAACLLSTPLLHLLR